MSDYEDDFENDHDDLNDRTHGRSTRKAAKKTPKKSIAGTTFAKDSGYDTLARDNTLGIKTKDTLPPRMRSNLVNATPAAVKSKHNILSEKEKPQVLSKHGGIHSSTPTLHSTHNNGK